MFRSPGSSSLPLSAIQREEEGVEEEEEAVMAVGYGDGSF